MLYLIGIGLKPEHLTLEALNALRECKKIYLENYTSKYAEGNVKELEKIIEKEIGLNDKEIVGEKIWSKKKRIIKLNRKAVEENFKSVLQEAKKEKIALLVFGNVFSATTHIQMLLDAKEENVQVKTIPGISIFSFLGKTGLSEYKFGRTVSIVFWENNYKPESFYDRILENYNAGTHTLCLLDIKKEEADGEKKQEEERLMQPKEAFELLKKIEDKRKKKLLSNALFCVISKAGAENEKIVFGKMKELIGIEFDTPACLIVCGKLDEKEKEAIELWKR